jgi:hypothetical protein
MKKVTLLVAAALLAAVPAFSAQLLNETFTYADGDLTTTSGGAWVNHSGSGDFIQTIGGEIELNQGAGSREDAHRDYTAPAGKVYACFEVRHTNTDVPPFDTYFAHFRPTANPFNFRSRIWVAPDGGATSWTLGLSATSASNAQVYWGSALAFGQTYRVVHSYDPADGSTQMWINPVSEASASITHTDAAAGGEVCDGYAFRQSGGTSTTRIDNLTVGDSFADVCDGATPTSSSSWGRLKTLYR